MMETATHTDPGPVQGATPMEGIEPTATATAPPEQTSLAASPDVAVAPAEASNGDSGDSGDRDARPPSPPPDTQAQAQEQSPEDNQIPAANQEAPPAAPEQEQPVPSLDPPAPIHDPLGENHSTLDVNVMNANAAMQPVDLQTVGFPGPMDGNMVFPSNDYFGSMDAQPPDALALHPDMLDATRPGSVFSGAQLEESRQCAFAKLEFPDGDFYMTTYAVELGRDARAHRQEMKRWRQKQEVQSQREVASSVGDAPQTPVRPTAPSVASVCRSNLSECGGIMGRDDAHVAMGTSKKKRKKKDSKSNSSSSQRLSRKNSLASNILEPVDYNQLAMLPPSRVQPDNPNFMPDPTEVPLVPIHPPINDDGPVGHKGISRRHLKIYYSFENQIFEMKVLGRNGAFLNNNHYVPEDAPMELKDGDQIQIGAVSIMFRLPNSSVDDDARSQSSDNVSGGISLNFEDGRGESIVVDDSSDDGFNYAEQQYDYSPHAFGWVSEEDEYSEEDQEEEYREEEHRPVKLKLKLKAPAKQQQRESKAEARARQKLQKSKKKEKLKAKQAAKEAKAKAASKSVPKAEKTKPPSEEKVEDKEKEREKEKKKEEKKEKVAVKTLEKSKEASPDKPDKPDKPEKAEKPKKPKEDREPVNQVTVIPPQDIPQPSTEVPVDPAIKTEPSEKPPEPSVSKDGRRVLTAEEAERLGLEPGTIIERKKGPGRPPKDGIMSKREKAEIMRRKKEAEKARKLGLDPESIAKVDLTKPKTPKDGEKASADKKPKSSEGAEGESAPPEGSEGADKKPVKISRPLRSPSPEMKETDYTEEQLQRPAANYVVLIHEAISNSKEGKLNLQQIYSAIERKYPYYKFKTGTTGWQSSVRHNLGQHDAFRKAEKEGKGWMWAINPGVSIEKERRKRVTPPPQPQPRPYYPPPPHGQSPYGHMMPPHGMPNYQHPPGPYGPRPPMAGAPGAPGAQQRTYQSPYGSQPLGQAANPQAPPRPGYPPGGARPPYGPYAGSPYGPPATAPPMSYPSASGASHPPPAGGSYTTAGPSPSPYSAPAPYNPYPGRPSHTPQPPAGHTQTPQSAQPSQSNTTTPSQSGQTSEQAPLPPRTPNIYSDSAPYSQLLNSFRDYYVRNSWTMLKREFELTQDQVVKLVDRGLERALHPERYINEREPRDENDKKDVKDEKDIEAAVKGMLSKFGHGHVIAEAQKRAGVVSESPASAPAPMVAPAATGQAPQVTPAAAQSQAPAQPQAYAQAPATAPASAPATAPAPAPGPAPAAAPAPVNHAHLPSLPAASAPAQAHQALSQVQPPTQPQQDAKPPAAAPAPVPAATANGVNSPAHAPSPLNRANGTGTPVPPPVEALTPLTGSPRVGPAGPLAPPPPPPASSTPPLPARQAPPMTPTPAPAAPQQPAPAPPSVAPGQPSSTAPAVAAPPAAQDKASPSVQAQAQAQAQTGAKRPLEHEESAVSGGGEGSEAKKAKTEA